MRRGLTLPPLDNSSIPSTIWQPQPGPQTEAYNSDADIIGYGGAAGGGKMLSMDTPIPTLSGWTTIGQIKIGETIFDERGQPCQVTFISDADDQPVSYRLTFDDGSTINACADHQWLTFDAKELAALTRLDDAWRAKRRGRRPPRVGGKKSAKFSAAIAARNALQDYRLKPAPSGSVRTTQQIAETLRTPCGRCNHAVPIARPLELPDIVLPLDPYTLGAWLGDGTSANGGITGVDASIWTAIESAGYVVSHSKRDTQHHCIRGIKPTLTNLGVIRNKHIPAIYLRASFAQRLALLQGLMDTDGHATVSGACEFDNTNYRIIEGVLELALSLGIKATMQQGVAKLNGRIIGPKWRIKFTTALPVFRLSRKLARMSTNPRRTTRFRYVVACEKIAPVPMRCISVDSPSHLYLAGRTMIPTHNTDMLIGLAAIKHRRSIIFRRVFPNARGIIERTRDIFGPHPAFRLNETTHLWRLGYGRTLEIGAMQREDDKRAHQGQARDFIGFDEATEFTESQVRFVMGWNRSTAPGQKCRVVLTFNPPTDEAGDWVTRFFGPWLDNQHHNPAKDGELRWYAMLDGEEKETGPESFQFNGETIQPKSRTFYHASLRDNPILAQTGYGATIDAMPEPLRSLLKGNFDAARIKDPWQVIPGDWVRAAQKRWRERGRPDVVCSALGVDVARGGTAKTVISKRYANWFAPLKKYPGKATPDGPTVAALVQGEWTDGAKILIDAIGVGTSPLDILKENGVNVYPVVSSEGSKQTDRSKKLKFRNLRAEMWWKFREALDPANGDDMALPDDPELLADLCAPKWSLTTAGILIESKDDIIERIGRSPDCGDAVVMACWIDARGQFEQGVFFR